MHSDDEMSGCYYSGSIRSDLENMLESQQSTHDAEDGGLPGKDERSSELIARLRTAAKAILHGASAVSSLTPEPEIRSMLQELFDAARRRGQASTAIMACINRVVEEAIAWDVLSLFAVAEERIWHLMAWSQDCEFSPRAEAFLARVSRCYLYGLDAETAILCRSVLDAEFEAEIPNDRCIDKLGLPTKQRRFGLADRIAVAAMTGRIDDRMAEWARDVKKVGDRAVHAWPAAESVEALLPKTVLVIRALTSTTEA